MNSDLLVKFTQTPGLLTTEELEQVKSFFIEYEHYHNLWLLAFGHDAVGFQIESKIDSVDWHINFKKATNNVPPERKDEC